MYKLPLWNSDINKLTIILKYEEADAEVEFHGVIELPVKFSGRHLHTVETAQQTEKQPSFDPHHPFFLDSSIQSHWVRRLQQ